MKVTQKIFFVEAAVFIALILLSTYHFALCDAATIVAGFTVAYLVPRIAYSRMSTCSGVGVAALAWAWMVTGVLGINYIAQTTVNVGKPLSDPALWHDAARYYNYALQIFHHQNTGNAADPFPGLPLATVLLWKVFGINIVPPLAMNMMLTLATIVLTGRLATVLLEGRTSLSNQQTASMAMAMNALLFFFLSHGTQLLKEPLVYFGVMLCALALASLNRIAHTRLAWRIIALFALGMLVVAAARTTYSAMMLMGVLLVGCGNRRQWRNALAMLALGAIIYITISEFGHSISFRFYDMYFDAEKSTQVSNQYIVGDCQKPLANIVGDYFALSFWRKLLLLPLLCAVQFVIPFPWLMTDVTLGELVPRIALPWYAIGGLTLFYLGWMSWRKNTSLGTYPLWVAFCFAVPAFMAAGSVSRYMLPFQPLMVPMAIFAVAMLREFNYRKIFTIFAIAYTLLLAVTLVACYYVQSACMQ